MAAILAILTFALFVTLDYVLTRRKAALAEPAAVTATVPVAEDEPVVEPVFVAGYQLPEELHYHRGHTWARVVSQDTVAVGLDDFARRLMGGVKSLKLPSVGAWLRQGGQGFRVGSDGRTAEMVSPVEGEVVEVNRDARKRPELVQQDPYGRGWLVKIRSANLAANLRNLMAGGLARRWTEDAREQLELQLMALSGSVLQDGGEPAPDFAEHMDQEDWKRLAHKFLLT